nr:1,6-anhydro-N-acetylmuramyl-L-alanine amidase AmpD [Paraneptunicella aestuarii]
MLIKQGLLCNTGRGSDGDDKSNDKFVASEFCDERPKDVQPSVLVIHNISLPPGQFGGGYIQDLFTGKLDPDAHPFFAEIAHLRVSAHCLIRRTGDIIQFVNFNQRAWHAGVSQFQGNAGCNDFSIGIELEGTDIKPYTEEQYQRLVVLSSAIMDQYPEITLGRIVGHNDIAFGRKTDPGVSFDWCQYRHRLYEYRKQNGLS